MKKLILSLVAVAIVSVTGMAQEKQKPAKTAEDRANKQIERMDKDLALTPEQKTKMKEIMVKRDQTREDLIKKYPEKNEDFKKENRTLMMESEKQIKAVLTPEQLAKEKEMREEAREKRNAKKAGEAPAPKDEKAAPAPSASPVPESKKIEPKK